MQCTDSDVLLSAIFVVVAVDDVTAEFLELLILYLAAFGDISETLHQEVTYAKPLQPVSRAQVLSSVHLIYKLWNATSHFIVLSRLFASHIASISSMSFMSR